MNRERESTDDPLRHAENIKQELTALIDHLREDAQKVREPKAQALFETAAEVLIGLRTACEHYQTKAEPAMA